MNAPLATLERVSLDPEWLRIEVLCRCLLSARHNAEPGAKLLAELARLQAEVNALRAGNNAWKADVVHGLAAAEMDILATVLAAEAQPKVAWHFQELLGGAPQAHPSLALVQTLLALEGPDVDLLHRTLRADGELMRRGLIHVDGAGALRTLRPTRKALVELLGWPMDDVPPPGSLPVRQAAGWADLVVPRERRRMLEEFLFWVRHRGTVVDRWKGQATGGPIALFAGPSGTGKTLAARVIATELGWPLYRVDLARLVSKYIGETEKNLGRLFDAAHGRELVLLFDEVDSLMSKRGEITEARDRYANMEVSYLLARIEDHRGPCVLTTNLRHQVDKAFTRRLQMVVEFPRPDRDARLELWQRLLPPRAPREPDLDLAFVAESVNITGGSIRNAALHAAYLAADEDTPISMRHVAVSVWRELAKERQQTRTAELGPLGRFLPDHMREREANE